MRWCHKAKPFDIIDIPARRIHLVSTRLKTIRSVYLETIMGTISAASSHSPVQILSASWSKLPEDENSFGSDFQRLGSVATSALAPTGKAWQTYPARQRSDLEKCGIPLGSWCGERDRDVLCAKRLQAHPLMPRFVGETLERWRSTYLDSIGKDVSFERDRSSSMQSARHGVPPVAKPFVRTFDAAPVRAQLEEIALLNNEIRQLNTTVQSLPEGDVKRIARGNLVDLASLRDAMLDLTLGAHERKRDELKAEIRVLIALNDMAREAEREMTNGGADVPLRLSVRDGNWVLKPAASTSWFARNKTRAANDAARLALLLGYPADQPVSLKMIRDRGFGVREYSSVLNHAREGGRGATPSWLAARALDIDAWKTEGGTVMDDAMRPHESRRLSVASLPESDDSLSDPGLSGDGLFDEHHYAVLPLRTGERQEPGHTPTPVHGENHNEGLHRHAGARSALGNTPVPAHDDTLLDEDYDSVPHFAGPDGSEYALVRQAETSLGSKRRSLTSGAARFAQMLNVARSLDPWASEELAPPLSRRLPAPPSSPPHLPLSLPPIPE
ncbi:hypothetical protein PHO31112_00854 [Pandoraea horticolens]|uniref:Uncharacterized protein n=2 Tax=Pandoraea horticolens TaxID=2508298 RepID=A0A5E4SP26_9BURK|nr:hypothetical protein PHO31112_00854 [Pandoraea horticolens]